MSRERLLENLFDPVSKDWLPVIRQWHLRERLLRLELAELMVLAVLFLAVAWAPFAPEVLGSVLWVLGAVLALVAGALGYLILRTYRAIMSLEAKV